MNKIKVIAITIFVFSPAIIHAQQPVKYQLIKLVEKVIMPASTPAEAFDKCLVKGKVDETRMFGSFYESMQKIGKELHTQTDRQIKQNTTQKSAGEQAMNDGFENMAPAQQAAYLKSHPQLQQAMDVSGSMMDLSVKMQDPAFMKKFSTMSDEEKAKLVMQYQQPQEAMNRKANSQMSIKAVTEAARLVDQFNQTYYNGSISSIDKDREAKEKVLDEKEAAALKPVDEKINQLSEKIGKGMTNADSKRLDELDALKWKIRTEAFERKLNLYQAEVSDLIARFKRSVQPFDDFLARNNYFENLNADNEAKALAQLASYQEGLIRAIVKIEDLSKYITVAAAQFQSRKNESEKAK